MDLHSAGIACGDGHFSDSVFESSSAATDGVGVKARAGACGEPYLQISRGTAHVAGYFEYPDVARKAIEFLIEAGDLDPLLFKQHIPLLDGQYGIAITNCQSESVHLIADLLGTVPIYYAQTEEGWAWSFKLRDLLPHLPSRKINPEGVLEVFLYRWLMGECTLLSEVRQVLPGECVTLQAGQPPQRSIYRRFEFSPTNGSFDQSALVEQTSRTLDRYLASVRQRYDRIAVLFSGGVDSSLLLAKAREHNFQRLVAVTARFPGHENPELERVLQIAQHLEIQPLLVDVDDDFIKSRFDDLVRVLERPPTYLNGWARTRIFEAIKGEVDVALTGEGADCLFGSDEFVGLSRFNEKQLVLQHVPWPIRRILSRAFNHIPNRMAQRLSRQLAFSTVDLIRRGAFEAGGKKGEIKMTDLVPELREYCGNGLPSMYEQFESGNSSSFISLAQNRSLYTSNRNQLFAYANHAAQFGIPVLHPFLSKGMLEIGKTLPDAAKRDAEGAKPILKKLACRYVPRDLVYGKKYDFVAPTAGWLEGPLSAWSEILRDGVTSARGLFDAAVVDRLATDTNRGLVIAGATLEIFFRQFIDS